MVKYRVYGEGFTYERPDNDGKWMKTDDIIAFLSQTSTLLTVQLQLPPRDRDWNEVGRVRDMLRDMEML